MSEASPTVDARPDADTTDYAADKRGAELAIESVFGAERSVFARPGLILGPRENIGRLPWWLRRVAAGGTCSRPGRRTSQCSTSTRAISRRSPSTPR